MERRKAICHLGAGMLGLGILGCENEPKPAATATAFNNEQVHQAFGTLDAITGDLETDSENFGGGSNWRDVVSEVEEHVQQLRAAIDDLRAALGYPRLAVSCGPLVTETGQTGPFAERNGLLRCNPQRRASVRILSCLFILVLILCCPANAAQMTLGELKGLCSSTSEVEKTACGFYIWGVTEGASLGTSSEIQKSGAARESKNKPFCVPEGVKKSDMELLVRKKMALDLTAFPEDRDLASVSFILAVVARQFPC